MKVISFISFLFAFSLCSGQSDLKPFAFFDSSGTEISYGQVADIAAKFDVVLFGEYHNDAVIHWIQLRLIKDLYANNRSLILGGEFFERDDQLVINEYLNGYYDEKKLISESKTWPNFETDYLPILSFANENGLNFYATNVPRRYASMVAKFGIDTLQYLNDQAKSYLADLPIPFNLEIPGYKDVLEMMAGHGSESMSENFVRAQAIKDATMASTIVKNHEKGATFVHLNGDFHSADYGGIYWYIKEYAKKMKVMTIKVFSSESTSFSDEMKGSGDIILIVPEDFTKTH